MDRKDERVVGLKGLKNKVNTLGGFTRGKIRGVNSDRGGRIANRDGKVDRKKNE